MTDTESVQGRQIVVLDGTDVPHPEDLAMLQALYSRSPKSVLTHLEKVREVGSGKFMDKFYTGYGHKSIGDCGTVTICAENVSMLAAKAIQDNPLYNGQEASTRYLDMAERPMVDPLGTRESAAIQAEWIDTYKFVLSTLLVEFEKRFPREEGQKKGVYKKAIKARAFDVARGFLPAGCTTFVAWHTNLRQAWDHLWTLRVHPAEEMRDLGRDLLIALRKRYPSSFGYKDRPEKEQWLQAQADQFAYQAGDEPWAFSVGRDTLDYEALRAHDHLLATRPARTELHQRFRHFGSITFKFMLDFGSFRDLQRHRSCVQDMPLLEGIHGFHDWYLEQIPYGERQEAAMRVEHLKERVYDLDASGYVRQYYLGMGFSMPVKITCSLPSAVYIAELRSGQTVHPTLRVVAQQIATTLKERIPYLALHHDPGPGVWDTKRGTQDITEKE